ncbi:hypothetical protein BDV27DRAFT_135798 [Aspergillus caelatus]|uniref:Transposase Tn5-like N-terminal domain-containing protein n=1 Tax=Aspergillus caelatus TaxID=61420 RepID=A0A5N6ZPV6_9EURO|nr:uncharacterized protein BDV27DRAFT_135798 [Aspergillus caelatus]KAE8359651.1 hypothetical protein BDV27DRAFT_135798 [Aspergillus caelatus]
MRQAKAYQLGASRVYSRFFLSVNTLSLQAACWTETIFAHFDLGDTRLNKRVKTLMGR